MFPAVEEPTVRIEDMASADAVFNALFATFAACH
jgi:hypothetical protein